MSTDPITPLTPPDAEIIEPPTPSRFAKLPLWARIAIIVAAIVLAVVLWQLTALFAIVVLITAIVAVVKNRETWLKFASPTQAKVAIAASAIVAFGFSSVGTAVTPQPVADPTSPAGFAAVSTASPTATPST